MPTPQTASPPALTPPALTPPDLALVIVAVDDLSAATDFWVALTGWETTEDAPVYRELRAPSGVRLGVYARTAFVVNLGCDVADLAAGPVAATEVYLAVDDVVSTQRRALALGARLLREVETKPWGDDVAYVLAPGGLVVALAAPTGS
ncbi:VOC family protein [Cellulomonas sp. P22]|uniref:VOC family protein n=1 Tax=Cellulomonas sp. P22 TaxID=3373189 RepID=UPI0037A77D23